MYKKFVSIFLILCFFSSYIFCVNYSILQHDTADYSLMPDCIASNYLKKYLEKIPVHTCYEGYCLIPKSECKKKSIDVINELSSMGGYDGVRYFDVIKKDYVPIFRECIFDEKNNQLYIKDKNFGKMYCTTRNYYQNQNNCAMIATLCRPLANPLFWEIKKNEFIIYVLSNETEDNIELYILIETSYKINWLFRAHIENAFNARIHGIQDWFVRSITNE